MLTAEPGRVWTVAEAKARLPEILRLAETEGPQRIGARKRFVVSLDTAGQAPVPRPPLGRWLVENAPRGVNLELPDRSSNRKNPFIDDEDE